jgi:uncharacterized protein
LLVSVVVTALVAYLLLLALLWRFQERVAYQPPRGVEATPVDARRVQYRAADGTDLFAYVIGDCPAAARVVLAFHGNAELARWLVPWARDVARYTRACVVLPEYRGYDGLTGPPTYQGIQLDARAALDQVTNGLGVPEEHIAYFGHSLGSAVAVELAATRPPRAVLLQSPFTSAQAMARRMILPGLGPLWHVIARVRYDTEARVATLDVPVWVAHGDRDFVVPIRMGRAVFEAARRKGELLVVPSAGHVDVSDVGARPYWEWFRRALA